MKHAVDEVAVGGEPGVVDVLDVVSRQLVAALVRVGAPAARLVVAAVRQQLVANVAVRRDPQSNVFVRAHAVLGTRPRPPPRLVNC